MPELTPEHARDEIVKFLMDTAAAHQRAISHHQTPHERFKEQVAEKTLLKAADALRTSTFVQTGELNRRHTEI